MLQPWENKRLWVEAANTYIYVKNRQFHSNLENATPHEAFHQEKPSLDHLQPFGRPCFVHIPRAVRVSGGKLQNRAQKGIFVGYTSVKHHYRIFLPEQQRVLVSSDVVFHPIAVPEEGSQQQSYYNSPSVTLTPETHTSTTSVSYPSNQEGFPTDDNWLT